MTIAQRFAPIAQRMHDHGLPQLLVDNFATYYEQLMLGESGLMNESDLQPVDTLPDLSSLTPAHRTAGEDALAQLVLIKLNGGLGTSMGLSRPKSLLVVKEGLSFLDITCQQGRTENVPLVLMNSFATEEDSLEVLQSYPGICGELKPSFLQHKVPKILQHDLSPVSWPANPDLEWCPPGHGDIYRALITSGAMDALLAAGKRYAFVSNVDNLGAVLDASILGYLVEGKIPFLMEVALRTEIDKKGGHLARRLDGQLVLRERAQCPPDDQQAFQDIQRYRYFNTNSIWLDLEALKGTMSSRGNHLGLPMIRNPKTVDPKDSTSPAVYQIETAMGAAIGVFSGAQAMCVPRSRFAPVKDTGDLLAVRSDAYQLTPERHVIPNPERTLGPVVVNLDPRYYRFVPALDAHFPHGAPSLLRCRRFSVDGEFIFGPGVEVIGDVKLVNPSDQPREIATGTTLEG